MRDWYKERKEHEAKTRAKLKADGVTLLELTKEGLLAKLPHGSEVTTNPDLVMSPSSVSVRDKQPPMLAIDGYPVELTIRQYTSSGNGGWIGLRYHDRLAVGVNWIWVDFDIKHKSKAFGYSAKARGRSFGFEVGVIVNYIVWWVAEKKRHELLSQNAKKQKDNAEDVKGQWGLALKRVRGNHVIPGNMVIEATPSGLKATITTDERHLVALLEAMEAMGK